MVYRTYSVREDGGTIHVNGRPLPRYPEGVPPGTMAILFAYHQQGKDAEGIAKRLILNGAKVGASFVDAYLKEAGVDGIPANGSRQTDPPGNLADLLRDIGDVEVTSRGRAHFVNGQKVHLFRHEGTVVKSGDALKLYNLLSQGERRVDELERASGFSEKTMVELLYRAGLVNKNS